jgi:hypothetical protein
MIAPRRDGAVSLDDRTTRRMAMAAAVLGLMVGPTRADVTITIE